MTVPVTVVDPTSWWLISATCFAAVAAMVTAVILGFTLKAAWDNLSEFKNSERVKRTALLFFDFYTQEYRGLPVGGETLRQTPYQAIGFLINDPASVDIEVVMMVHNYLEAVAALHWKNLIDSDLYFDSFGDIIVNIYEPLKRRLVDFKKPLTPFSRIPKLCADARAYLTDRAEAAKH